MAEFLSAYEAARILGITPPTAYRWIRRGILKGHRDGVTGRLFVNRHEVEVLAPDRRIRPLESPRKAEGENHASC